VRDCIAATCVAAGELPFDAMIICQHDRAHRDEHRGTIADAGMQLAGCRGNELSSASGMRAQANGCMPNRVNGRVITLSHMRDGGTSFRRGSTAVGVSVACVASVCWRRWKEPDGADEMLSMLCRLQRARVLLSV
jgi:hypothetical protein